VCVKWTDTDARNETRDAVGAVAKDGPLSFCFLPPHPRSLNKLEPRTAFGAQAPQLVTLSMAAE
jgi:hypothetical protein